MSDAVNGSYAIPVVNDNVTVGAFSGLGSGVGYFCNTTSGALSVTMTFTSAAFPRLYVLEISNDNGNIASGPGCLDQTSTTTTTFGTSASPAIANTSATTGVNDFIYSFITTVDGNTTAATGIFTSIGQSNATAAEIANGSTQSIYTTGWTITPGGVGQGDFIGGLLAFKNPVQAIATTPAHSAIIKFKPDYFRRHPWITKRNELRIETI